MNKYNPQIHHRRSIRLKGYDYTRCGVYYVTICTHRRECLFGEVVDGKMVLNPFGRVVATYWQRMPRHFPRVQLGAWVVMPNHIHGIIIITDEGDDDGGDDRNRRGEATPQASRYAQMPENAEAPGRTEPGGGCLALASDMAPYIGGKGEATPQSPVTAMGNKDAQAPGTPSTASYIGGKGEATPQPPVTAMGHRDTETPDPAKPGGGCLAPTPTTAPTVTADAPHGAPSGSVGAIVGNLKSTITRRINQMRRTPGGKVWQINYWEHIVRTPESHTRIEDYIFANPARWRVDDLHPDAPPNPFNQERE